MEIKKILVGKLPISCSECLLCEQHGKPGSFDGWCWALKTEVIPFHIPRPTACPLQVEEECVWKKDPEYKRTIFGIDVQRFVSPHGNDFVYDREITKSQYKFCPNCGRRIRYEEEE